MTYLYKTYYYVNILSLDVVFGACACSWLLADFLQVQLSAATLSVLGLVVWFIYTFDHLNDAFRVNHQATTARHRFHQRYFKVLVFICMVPLIAVAFLLFLIPLQTVLWGAALFCLVMGYFLLLYFLQLKSSLYKEVAVAILYAGGILLPPLSIYAGGMDWQIVIVFMQFSLLAFTNLLLFSIFEIHADEKDHFPSAVRVLGEGRSKIFLFIILCIQLMAVGILLFQYEWAFLELALLAMIMVLGSILFFRSYFQHSNRYRLLGDAVFMLPAVGMLF